MSIPFSVWSATTTQIFVVADPDDVDPVLRLVGHHDTDLRGADVEPDDELFLPAHVFPP
jgi:hypothetical protein